MKKPKRRSPNEMRPDYDFSQGARGKYAGRIARKATVVVLDPDVAEIFGTSEAVNSALRVLAAAARPRKRQLAG